MATGPSVFKMQIPALISGFEEKPFEFFPNIKIICKIIRIVLGTPRNMLLK